MCNTKNVKQKDDETEEEMNVIIEPSVDDANILPSRQSIATTVITDTVTDQGSMQAGEKEDIENHKQDYGSNIYSCEAHAEMDPDGNPEINPNNDLKELCRLFCQSCHRWFTTRKEQQNVVASCHTLPFKCRHCRKCFRTQFGRHRHERRHNRTNSRTSGVTVHPYPQGVRKMKERDQSAFTLQPVNHAVPDTERKGELDENEEANKDSFVCKYCKKTFGTHTNLRRHERRIHERRLLPKGECQKVVGSQGIQSQHTSLESEATLNDIKQNSEEVRQEEYMVDISSNISENLSFYIDGKIISTSAVTNCEMMEVNSAFVIGQEACIVSPAQIAQALKIETGHCNTTSDLSGQTSRKRRTSTPPLLPQIKTELESETILTTSSSGSEGTFIGTVLPRPLEAVVLQKDKTVYLSPKLKQLLQNHDGGKSTFALIKEGPKPLSLTILPAATSRFKRRTTSPNSPPQSITALPETPTVQEVVSPESNMDVHCMSTAIILSNEEEMKTLNLAQNDTDSVHQGLPLDSAAPWTGGRSCNQQPLDLSSGVSNRDSEVIADCVLDLSMSKKSAESDFTVSSAGQTPTKKTKPNSSMLEKVLLNQYANADVPPASDDKILSAPLVPDMSVMTDTNTNDPEKDMPELSLPSSPLVHTSPSLQNPAVLQTAPPTQLLLDSSSSPTLASDIPLSVQKSITNEELTTQSAIPVVPNTPVEISVGNSLAACNVTLPEWLNSTAGGVTHTFIPTTTTLSLQGSQIFTDPAVCELAQRTLVIDSVLPSNAHLFPPSVLVNQPNVTSLSFPPNVVVIEYTIALEPSNSSPVLQPNAVNTVSETMTPVQNEVQEIQLPLQAHTAIADSLVTEQAETINIEPLAQSDVPSDSSTLGSLENKEAAISSTSETLEAKEDMLDTSFYINDFKIESTDMSIQHNAMTENESSVPPLSMRFVCNACSEPFQSMKDLSQHIGKHSDTWPYKCEFCLHLYDNKADLLKHRSSYHGIGKIYVCRTCSKEFAFLCNLEQHHRDLHPGQECSHTEVENGKLRPENHNSLAKADPVSLMCSTQDNGLQAGISIPKAEDENDSENTNEEFYTTIKIMASEGVKPDVRLGINQHYPSFKPPPFPYHNRTPVGTTTTITATNFTTHNIPQTFSTTIRCTKCGKGFDNMPELHKHILACANASDKKRYTPKKNPIPLKQFAKVQSGVLLPARGINLRQNVSQKLGPLKKLGSQESEAKVKLRTHNKRKLLWMHRGKSVGRKASQDEFGVYICPHCSREFIYPASLKKHMTISCPLRPVCRKLKKRKGSLAQENNGGIRTRVTNVIIKPQRFKQGQKTTKTQTNESGSVSLPVKTYIGKGKITMPYFRPKRTDIISKSVHISKKNKVFLMEAIQSPLDSNKSTGTLGKSNQSSIRVQCTGKEIKQSEVMLKSGTEQQFSLRRGPITRSLQQANVTNAVTNNMDRNAYSMTPEQYPIQTDRHNSDVN